MASGLHSSKTARTRSLRAGFQTVNFMGTAVNMNGQTKVYPKDNYQTDIIANISLDWLGEPCFEIECCEPW